MASKTATLRYGSRMTYNKVGGKVWEIEKKVVVSYGGNEKSIYNMKRQ